MSHFAVLILGDDVEGQLAPFDESIQVEPYVNATLTFEDHWATDSLREKGYEITDAHSLLAAMRKEWKDDSGSDLVIRDDGLIDEMTTYSPLSQWDWWVEGGRYSNRLFHRNGRRVNSLRKGDLDLDAMRSEKLAEAAIEFDRYAALAASFPPPRPWSEICAAHGEDIDAARREWWSNEFVQAMREGGYWFDDLHEEFFIGDPDARERYLKRAEGRALSCWAVVKDGQWYERGKMGWFGMSTDEMDEDQWRQQVLDLVEGLPDDTLLTMCDLHI